MESGGTAGQNVPSSELEWPNGTLERQEIWGHQMLRFAYLTMRGRWGNSRVWNMERMADPGAVAGQHVPSPGGEAAK